MSSTVIPNSWTVPPRFRQRLGRQAGRQRTMAADGQLLLILHAPPKPAPALTEPRLFWRLGDGSWKSHPSPPGTGKPIARHLEEYEQALDGLERRLSRATLSAELFAVLREVGPIARAGTNMRLALQAAREECPADNDLISYRDQAEEIERLAQLILDEAKHGLDFAQARRGEEQSRIAHQMAASSHRLNVLVALFFPIATLSSIFGMNFHHGLESFDTAGWPMPMLAILGAGLLAGLVIALFVSAEPEPLAEPSAGRKRGS